MRLFFHLRKSATFVRRDDDGQEFETLDEAYQIACREIPEMVAEFLRQRTDALGFAFEITDEAGQLLMEIPFRETVRGAGRLDLEHARAAAIVSSRLNGKRYSGGPLTLNAFMNFPIACVFLLPDFRIAAVNEAFEASGVRKVSTLVGRPFFDLFPDRAENDGFAGRRKLESELRAMFRDPRPTSWRCQRYDVRNLDGAWAEHYWDVYNWPIFDEDGTLAGIAHSGTLVDPPPRQFRSRRHQRQKVTEG
ncbi:PAS domain-containing protein [Fulvimarina sp. 2208YS6-2-32]|uniref:PAS domain-containing protein n=1 Tax=Fulvimarina uroteuthidis TaxID=3098149 RepID=A0ABU5HZL4_9HYPH|nr:PAS domain-containing protein [Fulvimarina sp. 2208YS6-2-32]MDY8108571.1 PAS domain-containing protein [Fulvimarina sp. 2208YS6-2-32]